jgi:hypothetical protein
MRFRILFTPDFVGFVRTASHVDFRASISAEAIAMSNDTAAYVAGWLKKLRDESQAPETRRGPGAARC